MNIPALLRQVFVDNPRLAMRAGAGMGSKLRLLSLGFIFPLRRLLGLRGTIDVPVELQQFGRTCRYTVTQESDLTVLLEIFLRQEYSVDQVREPEVILDCGANVGAASLYFALRYPDAIIHSFEPDERTYRLLVRNTAQFKRIRCHRAAIAAEDGTMRFFVSSSSISSSLSRRTDKDTAVTVPTRSIDSILKEHKLARVDLLKFDIEGGEYAMFRGFRRRKVVRWAIGEVHYDLLDVNEKEFRKQLHGFRPKTLRRNRNREILLLKGK